MNETGDRNDTDESVQGPLRAALGKLGAKQGQIVVEYGDDEDVDEDVREALEAVVEGPLEDYSYDGVVDVVLLWWRDGDGDLTDELVDSVTTLEEGGFVLLLTPGTGRNDRIPAHELQEACATSAMSASGAVQLGGWMGQRLVGRR